MFEDNEAVIKLIITSRSPNDTELSRADNEQMCISAEQVADFSRDFQPSHWCHIGPRSEQSWNYDTIEGTRGKLDAIAENMKDILHQQDTSSCSRCGKYAERNVEV